MKQIINHYKPLINIINHQLMKHQPHPMRAKTHIRIFHKKHLILFSISPYFSHLRNHRLPFELEGHQGIAVRHLRFAHFPGLAVLLHVDTLLIVTGQVVAKPQRRSLTVNALRRKRGTTCWGHAGI